MNLFNRIKNIFQKPEPPQPEKNLLSIGPGDIVEVSLNTYQVTGKTRNFHRRAIVLTLQDGGTVRYLYVEEREGASSILYRLIDGRLDAFNEVPTTMELDGTIYYLDEQYIGRVSVRGKTPFMEDGEQYVWQFQSDDRKLLRIEWQDGRFMLYEGEWVIPADVRVIRGT